MPVSARDLVDLHAKVGLTVTLLSLVALASLELDHVDLLALELGHDFSTDLGAVDVRRTQLGRLVSVGLECEDTIEHDGVAMLSTEVDVQDVALADDDLGSTVFNDGIHGKASWARESHMIPVPASTSSLQCLRRLNR